MINLKIFLAIFITLTIFIFSGANAYATTINQNLSELPRTGNNPVITTQLPVSVTELPRTGIPAIAWGIALLAPIGYKILHNKKTVKINDSANTMWTEKQFKKDL